MTKILVAYGDGIGPKIMESTLKILQKAGAQIQPHIINIGYNKYIKGHPHGISKEDFEVIYENGVLLKGPLITPQGEGYKSVNVTIRKAFDLFINIRPVFSVSKNIDLIIIRENYEDLYNGIEYKFGNTALAFKYTSEFASTRIIRYAFEYAKKTKRKKVTCFSKDNILKLTDGMFSKIFHTISKEYPNIKSEHMLIDIGAAEVAKNPQKFDVIVTSNLYGDIISDIAGHVSGSIGTAGSCNIGFKHAMFEAVHGAAPDIANQNIANPLGLTNAALMMLNYIGQTEVANKIQASVEYTIKNGLHTKDMESESTKKLLNTDEFTEAIIENLDKSHSSKSISIFKPKYHSITNKKKDRLIGMDIFVARKEIPYVIERCDNIHDRFILYNITASGLQIWPTNSIVLIETDIIRLRFIGKEDNITFNEALELASRLKDFNIGMISMLTAHNGKANFSPAHGE